MLEWKKETDIRLSEIESSLHNYFATIEIINNNYNSNIWGIKSSIRRFFDAEIYRILNNVNIEELNRNKDGIRIKPLINAGYNTVNRIRSATYQELCCINGIGEDSIDKIKKIISLMEAEASKIVVLRFDPDNRDEFRTKLLRSMYIAINGAKLHLEAQKFTQEIKEDTYRGIIDRLKKEPAFLLRLFWNKDRIDDYRKRINELGQNIQDNVAIRIAELGTAYYNLEKEADNCWDDFIRNPSAYYNLVEEMWPVVVSPSSYYGTTMNPPQGGNYGGDSLGTQALMERIDSIPLELSSMKTNLRHYQQFGAKYIISQKKVLIGDEMGLGKTIQAIAAMAHLQSKGADKFLVVCPLSILSNWEREINKHSSFESVVLRGNLSERQNRFNIWKASGKVGLTTYETTGKLPFADLDHIDVLVVDEAHYVKNPEANRTKNVRKIIDKSDYVIYMTGTPLENRTEEMSFLVSSLNPAIGEAVSDSKIVSSVFKERIIPVYLRRVREDVLKELPELIEIEDWLIMNSAEGKQYDKTLIEKNYMQIRQISWNAENIDQSSKAMKLKEICDEAKEDNRKVLVFSYFLDTLKRIEVIIGTMCIGKIYGGTKPNDRQPLIDRFTEAGPGSVLLCQINTGGLGLNIQAASIVVFCEPQWKPSTENQALSRAYRMGQARSVMVHRLLITDSIEERMMRRLQYKKNLFDEYAEDSEIGDANLRLNEEKEMMQLIEEEIKKRGLEKGRDAGNSVDSNSEKEENDYEE